MMIRPGEIREGGYETWEASLLKFLEIMAIEDPEGLT